MYKIPAALILTILCASFCTAQTNYLIRNFSAKEYGGATQNWDITQTDDGIMYFANGSRKGMLGFDGNNWKQYPVNDKQQRSICAVGNKIAVGSQAEFGLFDYSTNGSLTYFSFTNLLPDTTQAFSNVWQTLNVSGNTFYRSREYFFVTKDTALVAMFQPKNFFHVPAIINNEVWVMDYRNCFYKYRDKTLEMIPNSEKAASMGIFAIIPFTETEQLLVTGKSGLFLFNSMADTNNIQPFKTEIDEELRQCRPYGALVMHNGDIAINTNESGVFILNRKGELKHHICRYSGLQDNNVKRLFQDKEGNLWMALNKGISFLHANTSLTVAYEGKDYEGVIYDIARYNNKLYLATSEALQTVTLEQGIKKTPPKNLFIKDPEINSHCWMFEKSNDDLIVLVATNGIRVISNGKNEPYGKKKYFKAIHCPYQRDVFIVIGREGGYFFQKKKEYQGKLLFETPTQLEPQRLATQVTTDSTILAIATGPSSYYFFETSLTGDLIYDQFVDTLYVPGFGTISHVEPVGEKVVVCTTEGLFELVGYDREEGKFHLKLSPWQRFNSQLKNHSKSIEKIKLRNNMLTFLKGRKAYQYNLLDQSIDSTTLNIGDVGEVITIFNDSNNFVMIVAKDGVIRYDQSNPFVLPNYKYKSIIRQVALNTDSILCYGHHHLFNKTQLHYFFNSVAFEFASPFYQNAEQTQFSFKLEGYDNKFSNWTKETKANYTNLPEGEYTFMVKAKNMYGQESETASWQFTILPPWYRTWWAYAIYALVILLFVRGLVALNSKRLLKRQLELEKMVAERTKEIEEKNNSLEKANQEIAAANKDITDSIQYAKRFQQAILPEEKEIKKAFPNFFVFYKPKDIVSGDFYWFAKLGNKAIIAAVDCTGHGVPGAFMSIIGHDMLHQVVGDKNITRPADALQELDRRVTQRLNTTISGVDYADGMDMALCAFDSDENTLQYAGAYRPLYIVRNAKIVEHKPNNLSIGGKSGKREKEFTDTTVQLEKGDIIYLCSDGFQDQFGGAKGKKFMIKNFKQLLLETANLPIGEQEAKMENEFNKWKADIEQVDDVLVIGIQV